MDSRILDWDSDLLGFTVARIADPVLDAATLSSGLRELERQGVRLVYWASTRECEASTIEALGGLLVDRKTTFLADLRSLELDPDSAGVTVAPADASMPAADFERLAIQSGEYSRFAQDPGIPREKFVELYTIWIHRSLRKEIASEVLAIREADAVAGMVTLGTRNGRGDIGLIAVHPDYRRRHYGEELVRAAQGWFKAHGHDHGQVVTQGQNIPACKLYEKCGYAIERVEYVYHFWL